jgi:hypothetical protein
MNPTAGSGQALRREPELPPTKFETSLIQGETNDEPRQCRQKEHHELQQEPAEG